MAIDKKLTDLLRVGRTPIENHLIDGFVDGRVDRRSFLRHGSVLGMSLPFLGAIAGVATTARPAAAAPGGTIRVATLVPSSVVDPVLVSAAGGLVLLSFTGEFLTYSGNDLVLKPGLAESWKPSADFKTWTFKLRQGVKYHDGQPFKAADVVATFDRLSDPKNASNALSAMTGYLKPGSAKAIDEHTVEFTLDAANGSFPYLVSSDNYNSVILPANYTGDYEKTFVGTGPFKLEKYTPKVGATFVRNAEYWGEKALPDKLEVTFYTDPQPMILAMQGGQADVIQQVPVLAGVGLLNDPKVDIISFKSAAHQALHMQTDSEEFRDKRVRQALALTIDREKLVKGLMKGRALEGNDSPFAPVFPTTDKTVPQRKRDVAKAKQLLEAAGMGKGMKVTLVTERYLEIPEYAQLVQSMAKDAGIQIELNVLDQGAYYGDAVYGKSQWLDSKLGITDYGHRGVPNVYLSAPLKSDGTWNSAHFKNAEYDGLVSSFIADGDLEGQRKTAGKIQRLLLDETPCIYGYFYDFLIAKRKDIKNVRGSAMSQLYLDRASKG